MLLTKIKLNPQNPRIIRDANYQKLVESLKHFPRMMELRPIVVDETGIIQGGNMRYKALIELGYKEVPEDWIKKANDFTLDELREFIIKDNIPYGEWDWQLLSDDWDKEQLIEWGLDIPDYAMMPDELIAENKNKPVVMKITFPTPDDLQKCESGIEELLNRNCPKAFYSVSAGEI